MSTQDQSAFEHHWRKTARAGFVVVVDWTREEHGYAILCRVRDEHGPTLAPFPLSVVASDHASTMVMLERVGPVGLETFIDVTMTLRREGEHISLSCNMPISDSEYFCAPIAEWRAGGGIAPVPDIPDDETIIDAPENASDLYPFVWLQPLTPWEKADCERRFVPCTGYAEWPLYQDLAKAGDAAAKRAVAATFRSGDDFVESLSGTMARMPEARQVILRIHGDMCPDDQVDELSRKLELPPDETLAMFLAGPEWTGFVPKAWQSVFALALVGQPADAALATQLVDCLRIGHYGELLTGAGEPPVSAPGRRRVLDALPAVPDAVAALPPSPAIAGSGAGGCWEVLGAGHLRMARQHLVGYAAGDVAEVVNVMPRERRERLERTVRQTAEHDDLGQESSLAADDSRQNVATSELADTVTEVMAADGLVRNMQGVTPTYECLTLSLTGAWAGSAGEAGWSETEGARAVRQLTEQAARRYGDRISSRRGKAWRELREQCETQTIDNSAHDRLVGVYRWVDRLVRVRLIDEGSRLILAFLIDQPAQPWIGHVRQGGIPLQEPVPLPPPAEGQPDYSVVTPETYQALGAHYGLFDLDPPPPATLTLNCTVSKVTLGDRTLIAIPPGYTAQSGTALVAVADPGCNIVCAVGSVTVPLPAPASPAALKVTIPSVSSPTSAGPVDLDPPKAPAATLTAFAIKSLDCTGELPITVMTAAPLFAVTIEVSCGLTDTSLGVAWQIRTYDKLAEAWRHAARHYDESLAERVALASAGRTGEVQRDTLEQACLMLLAGIAQAGDAGPRGLAPLFDWRRMTWQYQSWPVGKPGTWPEVAPSEATRPSSEALFKRFLSAQSASVLLPVAAGWEAWVLSYLQFQHYWAGGPGSMPVTAGTVPLIERILHAGDPATCPLPEWTVRVPTSMLYLQQGSDLPN